MTTTDHLRQYCIIHSKMDALEKERGDFGIAAANDPLALQWQELHLQLGGYYDAMRTALPALLDVVDAARQVSANYWEGLKRTGGHEGDDQAALHEALAKLDAEVQP